MRVPTWIYVLVFIGLLIANVKVYQTIFAEPVLTVSVLEAGKSNAVLIKSPGGKTVLIDTGSDASILRALGSALPMWQRKIDAVILTSPKKTFAGGLPDVMNRYHVTRTFSTGTSFSLDAVSINILAPATLTISYGSTSFKISSSTPAGVYISDGVSIK